MNPAILFGLGTMIAWGFWIAFGSAASNTMDPETAAFISYATAALVTGVYALGTDASFVVSNRGILLAAAAGIAAAVGVVSTFVGTTVGSTTIVATIGGMYFITAAMISVIAFGESITGTKIVGIGLAVAAILIINQ